MTRERMHLRAQAPNEGARRLAWWIGTRCAEDAITRLAAALNEPVGYVDRLLSGELSPGGELARRVWLATEGAVLRHDWQRAAEGTWFDEPAPRTPEQIRMAA